MDLERDTIVETAIERRNMLSLLGTLQLFRGLDASILAAIAAEIEWFSLPGGASLFEAGDPPDALYFVISGCIGAFARTPDGHTRLVGRVTAGETVGEMALISGKPRTASVHALRDSEIGRFSKQAFDTLLLDHPQAMLRIAQLTVQRLENSQRQQRGKRSVPKTFTILPHGPDVDVRAFAEQLVKALNHGSRTELVWSGRGSSHTSHWFANVESANDFVIYVADAGTTPWSKLCVRQADARCCCLLRLAQKRHRGLFSKVGGSRASHCSVPSWCCCRIPAWCEDRLIAGSRNIPDWHIIMCARPPMSGALHVC